MVANVKRSCTFLVRCAFRRWSVQSCGFKNFPFPVTFENVVFPPNGEMKLATLPKEPTYSEALNEMQYKTTRRMVESRGPEYIHSTLIHNQFAIMALSGGQLGPEHLVMLQEVVNKNLKKNQFGVWRVEAPWLPTTKRRQGKKGGGKGHIHRYVTPIRTGRIILELGGHIIEAEAKQVLGPLADRLPIRAMFVTPEILEERRLEEERIQRENTNPFDWETVMRYNMQNCSTWLSPYDMQFRGKYK